jgi:hypothetical protein
MVLGLTYYWSGQPEQARESFQSVANDDGGGVLKDEATYAVARMMIAEGRMAEAKSLLERLAASEASLPQGKIPAGLLDLERRSLLRTGLKGYRRGALGAPAAQIVRLLDWNGAALAKALLARLERESRGDSVVQLATHAEPKETSDEIVDVSVPSGEGVRAWPAAQAETFPARPATAQAGASASGTQGLGLPLLGLALAIVASGLVLRGRWARRSTKQ